MSGFRVSGTWKMLYIVYLDEFGHIGPYVSHDHPKHKTHPAFGLGGVVLPYYRVREFTTFFFQLKNNLLAHELQKSGVHPAKWEKKGASLYRTQNVQKYPQLKRATFRLINQIHSIDGFAIYVGSEKPRSELLDSKDLYHQTLKELIKRLDDEFSRDNDQFMIILDEQEENVMRGEIVEKTGIEMFGSNNRKRLIEPPMQAESNLYQTLQCADWLCGLFGRMSHLQFEPVHKQEFEWYETYFKTRLDIICRRSGIRHTKEKPASEESLRSLVGTMNSG